MMLRYGFLFDNDGVLIDSSSFHWMAWKALMEEREDPFMDEKKFHEGFGKRNDLILQEVKPDLSQKEVEHLAAKKEEYFRQVAKKKIGLLEGMEEFLKRLKRQNIPRIIASSTPVANLKMFLETTVLGEYFDAFVSAEEVPHGKPAPDVFLEAARRIDVPPRQCIVLEDSPAGILAGKAAGCFVVGLATTHPKEALPECDALFASPKDLDLEKIKIKFARKMGELL